MWLSLDSQLSFTFYAVLIDVRLEISSIWCHKGHSAPLLGQWWRTPGKCWRLPLWPSCFCPLACQRSTTASDLALFFVGNCKHRAKEAVFWRSDFFFFFLDDSLNKANLLESGIKPKVWKWVWRGAFQQQHLKKRGELQAASPCLAAAASSAPPAQSPPAWRWWVRRCCRWGSCSSAGRCRNSRGWSWSSGRRRPPGSNPRCTAGLQVWQRKGFSQQILHVIKNKL